VFPVANSLARSNACSSDIRGVVTMSQYNSNTSSNRSPRSRLGNEDEHRAAVPSQMASMSNFNRASATISQAEPRVLKKIDG
jgi:hypothetical protein